MAEADGGEWEEWSAVWDPNHEAYYYYNNYSGETVWEMPEGYTPPAEGGGSWGGNPMLKAVMRIQCAFRARKAKRKIMAVRATNNHDAWSSWEQDCAWVATEDPSGYWYYYHTTTGECVWEEPEEHRIAREAQEQGGAGGAAAGYAADAQQQQEQEQQPAQESSSDSEDELDPDLMHLSKEQRKKRRRLKRKLSSQHSMNLNVNQYDPTGYTGGGASGYQPAMMPELKIATATVESLPEWGECYDPNEGKSYWYNNFTGETQWEAPAGYENAKRGAFAQFGGEMKAVLMLQRAYRARHARKKMRAKRGEKAAEGGSSKWVETLDPQSGAYYYYNTETGECVWEKPADFDGVQDDSEALAQLYKSRNMGGLTRGETKDAVWSEWIEQWDADKKMTYYYNTDTGKMQWEKPRDFDLGAKNRPHDEKVAAALKIQTTFSENTLRKDVEDRMEAYQMKKGGIFYEKGKKKKSPWVEQYDPQSGNYYYYNSETQETTWDRPENFVPGTEDDLCYAVLKIQCVFRAKQARRERDRRLALGLSEDDLEDAARLAVLAQSKDYGELNRVITQDMRDRWIQQWDPKFQRNYYYNTQTGESVTHMPVDYFEGGQSEEAAAALKVQSMFRGHKARDEAATKHAQLRMRIDKSKIWIKQYDPNSKKDYYYNTQTGESQWSKPKGFVEGAEDEICYAVLKIQCSFRARHARKKAQAMRDGKNIDLKFGEYTSRPTEREGGIVAMTQEEKDRMMIGHRHFKQKEGGQGDWCRVWDEERGEYYYYNMVTGERTYDKPPGYVDANAIDFMNLTPGQVTHIMECMRIDTIVRKKLKEWEEAKKKDKWIESYDPDKGLNYYYNTETGLCVWDQPEDFVPGGSSEEMLAVLRIQCVWRTKQARRKVDGAREKRGNDANFQRALEACGGDAAAAHASALRQERARTALGQAQCDQLDHCAEGIDKAAATLRRLGEIPEFGGFKDDSKAGSVCMWARYSDSEASSDEEEEEEEEEAAGEGEGKEEKDTETKTKPKKRRKDSIIIDRYNDGFDAGGGGGRKGGGRSSSIVHDRFGSGRRLDSAMNESGGTNYKQTALRGDQYILDVAPKKKKRSYRRKGKRFLVRPDLKELRKAMKVAQKAMVSCRLKMDGIIEEVFSLADLDDHRSGMREIEFALSDLEMDVDQLSDELMMQVRTLANDAHEALLTDAYDRLVKATDPRPYIMDKLVSKELITMEENSHVLRGYLKTVIQWWNWGQDVPNVQELGKYVNYPGLPTEETKEAEERTRKLSTIHGVDGVEGLVAGGDGEEKDDDNDDDDDDASSSDEEEEEEEEDGEIGGGNNKKKKGMFGRKFSFRGGGETEKEKKKRLKKKKKEKEKKKKKKEAAKKAKAEKKRKAAEAKKAKKEAKKKAKLAKKRNKGGAGDEDDKKTKASSEIMEHSYFKSEERKALEANWLPDRDHYLGPGLNPLVRSLLDKVKDHELQIWNVLEEWETRIKKIEDRLSHKLREEYRRQRRRVANRKAFMLMAKQRWREGRIQRVHDEQREQDEGGIHEPDTAQERLIHAALRDRRQRRRYATIAKLRGPNWTQEEFRNAHHLKKDRILNKGDHYRSIQQEMKTNQEQLQQKAGEEVKDSEETLKQQKIDAKCYDPWQAASMGSSVDRFKQLFEEEKSRWFIQAGRHLKLSDPCPDSGIRILHAACWGGNDALVSYLITQAKMDIDARDSVVTRFTPLHEAARNCHADLCVFLIRSGASVNLTDVGTDTWLHWAARCGHTSVVRQCLDEICATYDAHKIIRMLGIRNAKHKMASEVASKVGIYKDITDRWNEVAEYLRNEKRRKLEQERRWMGKGKGGRRGQRQKSSKRSESLIPGMPSNVVQLSPL